MGYDLGMINANFKPPGEKKRAKALGDLKNECEATKKSVANIEKYWEPCRVPLLGDWLNFEAHGCYTYDQFSGKIMTNFKNTLYIQPLLYKKNSALNDKNLN